MILWIENPYNVEDSQEASSLDSKSINDEEKSNKSPSDSSATSPYNSANIELKMKMKMNMKTKVYYLNLQS